VARHLLADRADQQPREPAAASRADDEEVGVLRGVEQSADGRAFDRDRFDVDSIPPVGYDLLDRGPDESLRRLPQLGEERRIVHDRRRERGLDRGHRRLPRMHDDDPGTVRLTLLHREAEGVAGLLGAVDADEDLVHGSPRNATGASGEAEVSRSAIRTATGGYVPAMAINPRTIEQTELDLETSRAVFAELQLSPGVDDGSKLIAAAIAQAGAEIALALTGRNGTSD
jgi:hypothetical protein